MAAIGVAVASMPMRRNSTDPANMVAEMTGASHQDRSWLVTMAGLRRMFGLPDYFIRVQVADAAAFERWLTTQLLGDPAIIRVDSRITMKLVKSERPRSARTSP
jgi:hypothetical protein